jgi:putative lipoprotein
MMRLEAGEAWPPRRAAALALLTLMAATGPSESATLARAAPERARTIIGSGAPPPTEASAGAVALAGPTWVAEDIGNRGVIDDLQSHVAFTAEGRAQGSGGCNTFSGAYAHAAATLDVGPLASTKKACPPAIIGQEARFFEALGQTRGYRIENGLLYLLDARGMPVMRLWPRD